MAVTLFSSFAAYYTALKAAFAPFATVGGVTFLAGGTSASIYIGYADGSSTSWKAVQNVNYLGVPGPDLASGGLPVLALVAAFGVYRYMKKSRSAGQFAN